MKKEEQLSMQNNLNSAEENHNSNSSKTIIEREQVNGSPFWLIRIDRGWFLAMGEQRLTEVMETKNEIYLWMDSNRWQLIFNMIATICEIILDRQELEAKIKALQDKFTEEKSTSVEN